MNLDEVAAAVTRCMAAAGHPIVVGISGYAGSGKSTLARELVARIPGSVRMRGDDFLDPVRSHQRSTDWDGVERARLVTEVLSPFRRGRPGTFRRYDWAARALSAPEPVPSGSVMIVDLIGLFHPETSDSLDLRIWCDVDILTAMQRGMARDAAAGRDHAALWEDVWTPNERDFAQQFSPRDAADLVYTG
ncbi:uridine kinase [Microbacterium sp. W4I4]|uniref:uridine kinase family protein n=1 Tax=Microbacterium sp. W4I4 TaxID=3042295 RepID=UPI00277DC7E5|nr:phosphoglycerate transporter [Microbacterium sp. W4I4]MDQ0613361.1 uridine kinase [Microbacterium sp. W4I4]